MAKTIRYIVLLGIGLALLASPAIAETKLGQPISVKDVTPVSAIMDKPKDFIGKRVLVKGLVVEVCAARGCWLDIASDRKFEKIQVKVVDGEIVFPMSARGKQALVEGVVEELALSREEMVNFLKHRAEEQGTPFDPAGVKEGGSIYRIRGLGAVVLD